jgi:hypothetical protein
VRVVVLNIARIDQRDQHGSRSRFTNSAVTRCAPTFSGSTGTPLRVAAAGALGRKACRVGAENMLELLPCDRVARAAGRKPRPQPRLFPRFGPL